MKRMTCFLVAGLFFLSLNGCMPMAAGYLTQVAIGGAEAVGLTAIDLKVDEVMKKNKEEAAKKEKVENTQNEQNKPSKEKEKGWWPDVLNIMK